MGYPGQGITLYAGMSGPSGGPANGDGTFNSCASCSGTPALCACNTHQVADSTPVVIIFYSDYTPVNATPYYVVITNQTGVPISATQPYTGPNIPQTLNLTWGNICNAAFGTTCAGATTAGIRMGIWDGNTLDDNIVLTVQILAPSTASIAATCGGADGTLCKFHAYAGDQSIYIKDPTGDSAFPGTTAAIRFFVSNVDFDHADAVNSTKTQDLAVGADGSLATNIIDGLDNDPPNPYYLRSAAVDLAGNVFGFVDDTNIQDPSFGNCSAGFPAPGIAPTDGCIYKAYPDQVLGLLTKDLNCFIATASYGSSLEPKLNVFREFRNRFLISNPYGKKLVLGYYHWGPYAARWIADRDWARSVSRAALWPLWAYSSLANRYGLEIATVIALMTLVILLAAVSALTALVKTSWIREPRDSHA